MSACRERLNCDYSLGISDNFHLYLLPMIYLTQLIYVKPGQESVFDEFEQIAIPIVNKYNGKMLLRTRIENVIDSFIGKPYEIHLVAFESEDDFQNFLKDDERARVLHLKDQSVDKVVLYKGSKYG